LIDWPVNQAARGLTRDPPGPFDNRDRGRARDDGWIVFLNTINGEGEFIVVEAICRDKR
jgi:hypothetical protein